MGSESSPLRVIFAQEFRKECTFSFEWFWPLTQYHPVGPPCSNPKSSLCLYLKVNCSLDWNKCISFEKLLLKFISKFLKLQVLRYNTGSAIRPKNSCQSCLVQSQMQPEGLHETRLRWNQWFQMVSKLPRSIPNATSRVARNQTQMKPVVSKLTPSILNATSGRVNFCNQAGCNWNWTMQLFETAGFMQLQPSWLHLELNDATFAWHR